VVALRDGEVPGWTAVPVTVAPVPQAVQLAAIPEPQAVASAPVRRSLVVQPARQTAAAQPTPANKTPGPVPQPEPDTQAPAEPQTGAPSMDGYVDGDYCEDCQDCRYGWCDLHRDLKTLKRNMHPHYPYEVDPWTYYYFRPYNYQHIRKQQEEAAGWGAEPAQPYSRKLFDKVYAELEKQQGERQDDDDDDNK